MMLQSTDSLKDLGIKDPGLYRWAEYWFSLPKTDFVPSRDTFRPEHIPDLLPQMVIHEIVSPDFIRLRLAGNTVEADYQQALRGKNYLDFVEPDRRETASRALQLVCEQPAGMFVRLRSRTQAGRVFHRESMGMPMRNAEGVTNFVYFFSSKGDQEDTVSPADDKLRIMNVLERRYIDIGAGVPDFQD